MNRGIPGRRCAQDSLADPPCQAKAFGSMGRWPKTAKDVLADNGFTRTTYRGGVYGEVAAKAAKIAKHVKLADFAVAFRLPFRRRITEELAGRVA